MKNKGGENEWWVRETIRKENVSSHGIHMNRLYQTLKVNLGKFLVFRVLLTLTNDICLYSFDPSANVNHLYQFFDKTCKIITYIVIWFWWLKCYFSLGISLTQNPQHLRLTSICSHSIKLSYLLSYINLVLNSVSHELKRSLFHAKLRIFGYKTISMIKRIQGIFWL